MTTEKSNGDQSRWFRVADEPRDWEDFYRERWSYDRRRQAVIAVYGTARDFRPFIEAFRIGCRLQRQPEEGDE